MFCSPHIPLSRTVKSNLLTFDICHLFQREGLGGGRGDGGGMCTKPDLQNQGLKPSLGWTVEGHRYWTSSYNTWFTLHDSQITTEVITWGTDKHDHATSVRFDLQHGGSDCARVSVQRAGERTPFPRCVRGAVSSLFFVFFLRGPQERGGERDQPFKKKKKKKKKKNSVWSQLSCSRSRALF